MSDKVKLIVEIPKLMYESVQNGTYCGTLYKELKNGIPLDDVKAEMEKHQFSREYCCDHNIDTAIDMGMVRIILDNIGKESEDTVRNARKVTKKDSHKEWWDSFYKGEVKPNE